MNYSIILFTTFQFNMITSQNFCVWIEVIQSEEETRANS